MDTPKLDSIRAQIKAKLATQNQTVADLARYLNKDYTQVYNWITGRNDPNGEITLQLTDWLKGQNQ